MPDDPHTHPEGSFSVFAERQVDRLIRANRVNRIVIMVLSCVAVVLLAVSAFIGYNLYQTTELSHSIRQGSIQSCQNGNAARATNKMVFDELIDTSVNSNVELLKMPGFIKWKQTIDAMPPGPDKDSMETLYNLQVQIDTPHSDALKQVENFKAYIAKRYAPVNCGKIYPVHDASGR